MRAAYVIAILVVALTSSGCFRTVVDTGRAPSRMRLRDDWVMGFASGLITERVQVARACPFGVARMMTEQSPANLLVQMVTFGILSPRTVVVTCAAGPRGPHPFFYGDRWGRGWGPPRHYWHGGPGYHGY